MAKYNTIQRELLLRYLNENKNKALTVTDITNGMKASGNEKQVPAESTVYRLIKELVEDGTVKRTVSGCSRKFLYQITDSESCHTHLHMKCEKCGKMLHMNNTNSKSLIDEIYNKEDFCLDSGMVLSGVCKDCN